MPSVSFVGQRAHFLAGVVAGHERIPPTAVRHEKLASHFIAATIKEFPAGQAEAARKWIAS